MSPEGNPEVSGYRREVLKNFNLSRFESHPLGEQRPIKLSRNPAFEFKEKYFPLKRWEIGKERSPHEKVYSLSYCSTPLSRDELFKASRPIPLDIILFRLRLMRYPQKEPVSISENTLQRLRTLRGIVEDVSGPKASEPDIEAGYPSGDLDANVVIYLSALLSKPSGQFGGFERGAEKINTIIKTSQKDGLNIDRFFLSQILFLGFRRLVRINNVEYLLKSGWLKRSELEKFFSNACYWTALTYTESLETKDILSGIPFQTRAIDESYYPHPLYFPSAMNVLMEYAMEIPEIIPPGISFSWEAFKNDVEHLFQLGQLTADYGVRKNIISSAEYNRVINFFASARPLFEKINSYFLHHRRELTRESGGGERAARYTSYQKLRSEILEAGGRAPRKPLFFKVLSSIKNRE